MRWKSTTWKVVLCATAILGIARPGQASQINVAIPGHLVLMAFHVAKEEGYYKQEGLDVNLILMRDTVANQALMGGNVEFASVGGASIPPILRGAPLRFIFTSFVRPIFEFYAKPGIQNIRELRGKRVAIPGGIGSGPDTNLREILKKYNLEGGRDLVILGMAGSPTVYTAFIGGAVDAAVLSALYAVKAQEAGFRRLASFAEEDLVQPQGSIVVREDLLKSDLILVERFVRGTFKGLRFARTNSAQTIRVWSRNNKIEEALGTKLYKILLPAMTVDGILNEEFQRRAVEDVLPRVGLEKAPPLDRIFDYSLVRKVKAQLEAQGWKP